MEKLIELLNEYDEIRRKKTNQKFERKLCLNMIDLPNKTLRESELIVISKTYGFIKRLRENDHLDMRKLDSREQENQIYFDISDGPLWAIGILSIQEEPIDLLCNIIK